MLQAKGKILLNQRIKGAYFHCLLEAPAIARQARPGQFLNIKLGTDLSPLLRRPFSIHRLKGEGSRVKAQVGILYAVVGEGSRLLSQKQKGEYLDLIGPLGNGFVLHPPPFTPHPILVAGGMGVAPLVFLARRIAFSVERRAYSKPIVLIGAKTKNQILCEKEFKDLGCQVKVATDDGSGGFKGRVTDLLKDFLRLTINDKRLTIYACGPRQMLKQVCGIACRLNIPAQISLEEHLACGIGACLGCAVETIDGYQRVCKDGPVFWANQILW